MTDQQVFHVVSTTWSRCLLFVLRRWSVFLRLGGLTLYSIFECNCIQVFSIKLKKIYFAQSNFNLVLIAQSRKRSFLSNFLLFSMQTCIEKLRNFASSVRPPITAFLLSLQTKIKGVKFNAFCSHFTAIVAVKQKGWDKNHHKREERANLTVGWFPHTQEDLCLRLSWLMAAYRLWCSWESLSTEQTSPRRFVWVQTEMMLVVDKGLLRELWELSWDGWNNWNA